MSAISILFTSASREGEAIGLASQWNLPLIHSFEEASTLFILNLGLNATTLHYFEKGWHSLSINFLDKKLEDRARLDRGKSLLLKACGIKVGQPCSVIDATAGLGRDSFMLAAAGCEVLMIERSPIMAYLLNEALQSVLSYQSISLSLIQRDAKLFLENLSEPVDVIYLDPMHPVRKKSALVKIEMRLLRALVGADEDSDALLSCALKKACKRVVVKRPRLSEPLAGLKPDLIFEGKHSRYDVYMFKNLINQESASKIP